MRIMVFLGVVLFALLVATSTSARATYYSCRGWVEWIATYPGQRGKIQKVYSGGENTQYGPLERDARRKTIEQLQARAKRANPGATSVVWLSLDSICWDEEDEQPPKPIGWRGVW